MTASVNNDSFVQKITLKCCSSPNVFRKLITDIASATSHVDEKFLLDPQNCYPFNLTQSLN